ncbi:MAG: hypothetical protein UR25_C0003G0137 [Candidatus Nomurabacteria bacterium GW2011_GWE1_32_28]|uniref:Isoprenylcysteine carboxyl methyltransferase n=1 Tax=Candidatus Nomurabacteria bacterium GW2011_GWF1_31_48 TaxID=1618767 RepID=A0A0F9YF79_9BACT|nr:MAG: hypothetical protein UR10_C0003G0136 [Candidatus Nomurabacteria bacterium GW2011_GWF2_30_133]KKP28776.1 MAG: hypothetical protein UR18_C0002G0188 [Candidatus Nomurabacteria bacterium GW2011_GWE2_31_40]KKP30354.1 MAG: hypothetical protein UR19_C0003G0190 [Candidatus Nomurabacteria bacterium GW2011_GWF1_31_48]KKP34881.1 MAG: hypothetical protein UR25_C0003G0137 [Candidatus Nomurabacteria bacterium GW2011_GWE1_32_28]HAS80972.1 hypothetical protein [Candidatus Nomurabacteria bacterium]
MDIEDKVEEFNNISIHKNRVHRILVHSYLFFFVSFLVGLLLDFIFPLIVFENLAILSTGFVFLVFGTFLIIWSQKSSHKLKVDNSKKEMFFCGPYRYTRTPTHFGLFFLMFGFGILANALFLIIISVISFVVTKLVFIKKEEEVLTLKYGDSYIEYKKAVKF